MLRLSLEVPTCMLQEWSPLLDLDFVLAHKVLEDRKYAQFFHDRDRSREVLLDNSTHEFGKPLPIEVLKSACELCRADTIIAPDIVNPEMTHEQYEQNLQWLKHTSMMLGSRYQIGGVLCGFDAAQRARWITTACGRADMICFSFHIANRVDWWEEFVQHPYYQYFHRVHVLGMISRKETQKWVEISKLNPWINFSFDTSKPLKWGVQGVRLKDIVDSVRGGKVRSKEVLDMTHFSPEQIQLVEENIMYLRTLCQPESVLS